MKRNDKYPVRITRMISDVGSSAWRLSSGYQSLIAFIGEITGDTVGTFLRPGRMRWKDFAYYLDLCGARTLPIVIGICTLMGVVVGFQAGFYMRDYGLELLVAEATAYSVLKELGPLLVAIVATGRAGSAFAAELGTMKVNDEIAALDTMGIRPGRFLVVPKIFALAVAMPILTAFGDVAGMLGGGLVGYFYLNIPAAVFVGRICDEITPLVFLLGLVKSFVFAILIALVGCWKGMTAPADGLYLNRVFY